MKTATSFAALNAFCAALLLNNGFIGLLCMGLVLTLCLQIAATFVTERK